MSTLWVYGDSFASPEIGNWPIIVAKELNLDMQNNAISGGSTEHAINSFVRDVANKNIKSGDVVIFVTSTPGRLHFQFQEDRPETASIYLRDPNTPGDHDWYWANKKHIEWWMLNQNHAVMNVNQLGHISLIKDIAYSMPECTFICLSNSRHDYNNLGGQGPSNFLRSYTYLNDVSNNEIIFKNPKDTLTPYIYWTEYTRVDARTNHLTIPNLKILANLIVEAVQTKDISNITYDKFKKQCVERITTKEEYISGCNAGMYTFKDWIPDLIR